MKSLVVLLLAAACSYAYIEEEALDTLQTLDHWNTFRISIGHTSTECFYLPTNVHDTVHVVYQVLRGGDNNIAATIIDPTGNLTYKSVKNSFGWYDEESAKLTGTYQLCFKNDQFFTTKILYIGVLAVHKDRLFEANGKSNQENATAALDEFSTTAMQRLGNLSVSLHHARAYQTMQRIHNVHDLYAAESNQSYVQNWAICQIVGMVLCSVLQVFSIRRLFASTLTKKNARPPSYQSQTTPHFILSH